MRRGARTELCILPADKAAPPGRGKRGAGQRQALPVQHIHVKQPPNRVAVFKLHQPGLDRFGREIQREQQLAAGIGAGDALFQNMPREEKRELLFASIEDHL